MRVLAISGSLRRDSYNTKLLRAAEELAPAGLELEFYEELELVPPYNEDQRCRTHHEVLEQRLVGSKVSRHFFQCGDLAS